jgi:predicted dehydrogenase
MLDAAKEGGKFLMIGHNQRLVESHIRAKRILDSGELGRILSFRTIFAHGGPETWLTDFSKSIWFYNKNQATFGVLGDLGVHKIDLLRWLVGDEVCEVKANIAALDKRDVDGKLIALDDNAVALLRFRNGVIGTMAVSWTYYGGEDNSTVLMCENGVLRMNCDPRWPLEVIKPGEKRYYEIGHIQTNDNQTNSGVIDMFISALIKGEKPAISGYEGMAVLRVIEACVQSSETGQSVSL